MLTVERTIWCETEDCGNWNQTVAKTKEYALRVFKREGWKITEPHKCPECIKMDGEE